MQSLFPSAGRNQSSVLLQFPAGKCVLTQQTTGKYQVSADARRGQIQLTKGSDGILHFKWLNLTSNSVEEDRMVMARDCKFKRVNTGRNNERKDRVYLLKIPGNTKPLMFWMQDIDDSKDENYVKTMNTLLENPNAPVGSSSSGPLDLMQLFNRTGLGARPVSGPPSSSIQQPPASNIPFGSLDLSSLLSNVGSTQPPSAAASAPVPRIQRTPNLSDIFTGEDIVRSGILNDPSVQADLIQHLPLEQQNVSQLETTVRSAQFRQSLGSLSSALRNPDNFQSVLSNFQLNPADGNEQIIRGDGVGAFLSAIQANQDRSRQSQPGTEDVGSAEGDERKDDHEMDQS